VAARSETNNSSATTTQIEGGTTTVLVRANEATSPTAPQAAGHLNQTVIVGSSKVGQTLPIDDLRIAPIAVNLDATTVHDALAQT
tara:strand:- start:236 stop:490 length:255 start_codon:yes stop_codon:yes gene_type:complete